MSGVTFDTGALIGLERKSERMKAVLASIVTRQLPVTVPAVVVAEWYRGQQIAKRILAVAATIEPTTEALARSAGAALRATRGNNAIDAIVMASAAQRGDIVYTADMEDLQILANEFPDVRVLRA